MKNSKLAPRFFIFMLLFVGTVFSIVFIFTNFRRSAVVEKGSLEFRKDFECVIIRDEDIVEVDEFGKIEYQVAEGAEVIKGELVASIYELSYNEKTVQDLIYIKQEIQDYQENVLLEEIVDVGLVDINNRIEQKTREITDSVNGKSDKDILQLARELESIMQEKETHLKVALRPDETLDDLYFEKDQILLDINRWKVDMLSEGSGIISFYYDGYEKLYNMENLDSFDIEDIKDTIDGADVTDFYTDRLTYPIYKLVNSNKWYISVVSDKLIPEFNKNTFFTMIFAQNTEEQYIGELLGKRIFKSGYIYTFEFVDPIKQLLDVRTISVEMYNEFEGFYIPSDAIQYENGNTYLMIKTNDEKVQVPIKVATIQEGMAIVNHIKGFDQLQVGDIVEY